MSYIELVRQVAVGRADEIRGDLDAARAALRQGYLQTSEAERRVKSLEFLLELASAEQYEVGSPGLTLHQAMAIVLCNQPGRMLRAGDLAAEIARRGLYRMKDGRPAEAQQIRARTEHYGHLFERQGTFIKLRDDAEF